MKENEGELAQMVEWLLSMQEALGSIPRFSNPPMQPRLSFVFDSRLNNVNFYFPGVLAL